MPRPPRLPSHLPPALAARLSADDARELDALRVDQGRRRRRVAAGLDVPDFLAEADRAASGAGALWNALPERFTVEHAVEVGRSLRMDAAAVADALRALRSAEYVADVAGGLCRVSPPTPF